MREMKDSGIEWIGKIPKNWTLKKGKFLFKQRNTRGNAINLELLSPTQHYGVISQSEYEKFTGMKAVKLKEKTDLSQLKTIHNGDYCISLRSFQGGFEFCENEGVVSPAYQVFYAQVSTNPSYYKYLFKNDAFISKMNSFTMSLRDGKNIAFSDFGNTLIPYPPLLSQQAIADFLDAKCADIDSLTGDIQKQINILKEYKKSVITQAVTKGLDPNVEMKESGIAWIGKIPKDWKIVPFKFIAIIKSNLVDPTKFGEFHQIAPDSIEKDTARLIVERTVKEAGVDSWNHLFFKGQILYSKIRPVLNKICVAPYDGLCSADMYPIETYQFVEFIKYAMISPFFVSQVDMITRDRIKMPKINQNELGNINILIPSLQEQQQIANFLDAKCANIDAIISGKQKQLDVLKEYKKSLIYEYVTGKKEVPCRE